MSNEQKIPDRDPISDQNGKEYVTFVTPFIESTNPDVFSSASFLAMTRGDYLASGKAILDNPGKDLRNIFQASSGVKISEIGTITVMRNGFYPSMSPGASSLREGIYLNLYKPNAPLLWSKLLPSGTNESRALRTELMWGFNTAVRELEELLEKKDIKSIPFQLTVPEGINTRAMMLYMFPSRSEYEASEAQSTAVSAGLERINLILKKRA